MVTKLCLAAAPNLLIRRHAYAKAYFGAIEESDLESAPGVDTDELDTDESTDDGAEIEVLEPYQVERCLCLRPTWRMPLVPNETEYRCFECLNAHYDQSASFKYQIKVHTSTSYISF